MSITLSLIIDETSQVGDARRKVAALAERIGLDEQARGRLALIVTEAATNIVHHAQNGEILLNLLDEPGMRAVEIIALDHGPGMADIGRCLADGYSTAGTPGGGLGAVQRLSDLFDIYSQPGRGTVLLSRVGTSENRGRNNSLQIGVVNVPKKGETVCGNSWAVVQTPDESLLTIIDGLGHGPIAAEAADAARRIFCEHAATPSLGLLARVDQGIRSTRGAVMAMARLRKDADVLEYCGIGNISGMVVSSAASRAMVSLPGTLGHQMRRSVEFSYPWDTKDILILHSDGLTSHVSVKDYAGLLSHHPSVVAAVLYRDYTRGRDDATVLVARRLSEAGQ